MDDSYMDAALNHLRATGAEVRKEDLARLAPLSHKQFNMLGRYHFAVPEEVLRGELRPLRGLNDADEEGPQRGSGRHIPTLVSKIRVATTNAVARGKAA
jgi:hypothetical protein